MNELSDRLLFQKKTAGVMLPEIELMIDDSLGFSISVYGWLLPEDHGIFTTNLRSVCNITVSDLIKSINSLQICPGVEPYELSSKIVHHSIPKPVDPLFADSDSSFPHQEYWRTKNCSVLCESDDSQCPSCHQYSHKSEINHKAKEKKLNEPAHLFSPISQTAPQRIKLTLQRQRLRCAELEQKIVEMEAEIKKSSIEVDHQLGEDLTNILSKSGKKTNTVHGAVLAATKKVDGLQLCRCKIPSDDNTILFVACYKISSMLRRTAEKWHPGASKSKNPQRLQELYSSKGRISRGSY